MIIEFFEELNFFRHCERGTSEAILFFQGIASGMAFALNNHSLAMTPFLNL